MDFYDQSYSFPYQNGAYYNQIPYETGYYDQSLYSNSYYPQNQSSSNFYSYEFQPAQSLIAYSPCHDVDYEDNTYSIQYSVHHSIAAPLVDRDLDFPDYDPHPYKGGYDMDQTYGKALPPNDQICYPPTPISVNNSAPLAIVPVPQQQEDEEDEEDEEDDEGDDEEDDEEEEEEEELPIKEEAKDLRIEAPPPEEEEELDDEESIGSDEESEGSEDSLEVAEAQGNHVDQIPAGYGLEAYDLCENLFGYWPCLSKMKMKKRCGECGSEITVNGGQSDADEWNSAADYFFGNPNPYKGSMESSGYGYDQMQYQYQPSSALVMYEQPHPQYGQNSWFP